LLVFLFFSMLTSCTDMMEESESVQRNGLVYAKGSEKPFTGVLTGTSRNEGYRNHPCRFEKEYKEGKLHGRSTYYYLNGKTESIEPYQNGILHGVATRYYESGQIKARIHFEDGFRGGPKGEMFWNADGSKARG